MSSDKKTHDKSFPLILTITKYQNLDISFYYLQDFRNDLYNSETFK